MHRRLNYMAQVMLNKRARLSSGDLRATIQLLGELGELGRAPPAQQRAHLMGRLAGLLGAGSLWWSVIGRQAVLPDGAADAVVCSQVHGLDAETLRRWEEHYLAEGGYHGHPMWSKVFAAKGHTRSFRRVELVDDRTWYNSPHISELARGFGADDVAVAVVPVPGCGELCFAAMRAWGERGFGDRERGLLALLTRHTTWLARSQAELSFEAQGQLQVEGIRRRLAPRHRALLAFLLTGRSEKEIAAAAQLSTRTAHKYVEQIYRAFRVSSRAELMGLFIR
jgi:DNA-binding CsgD family transcriptional regulator